MMPTTMMPITSSPSLSQLHQSILSIAGDTIFDEGSPQQSAFHFMTQLDNQTTGNVPQRFSMVTAYFALTDTTSSTGGSLPSYLKESECNWPMVSCTNNLVTQLSMPRQQLNGTIPPEIANLKELQQLDLAGNNMAGPFPPHLYELTNIKTLSLENNQLTGTLTDGVGNWTTLEFLALGNNAIGGNIPSALVESDVSALRFLSLTRNQIDGQIPSTITLPNLYYLDLSFNQLTGPAPSNLTQSLLHLYLDHNNLEGVIPSWTVPSLESLFINNNNFSGGLPASFHLLYPQLINLYIQHNDGLTVTLNSSICDMDIFFAGNLVHLGADCTICTCVYLCGRCYNTTA
eukprot:CAMPEP_0116556260 /NCGR_PEP_ID=MMETSP0397-20121206/8597_1 /TAXON_ID=216820 /ORGANISM="Cyclophora tenuis, Strain ECT3854" /LENGTH=344 /DNA_ID=CAMNT_0004081609 /DNA_START=50 /DNA_END=1084 /DNA_ORIENTATION=+